MPYNEITQKEVPFIKPEGKIYKKIKGVALNVLHSKTFIWDT